MSTNRKKPSAADVLRQEMQQPLVPQTPTSTPQANPTPLNITNMSTPTDDAKLKAAAEAEAKLKQQVAALQAQLAEQSAKNDGLSKDLKEAKDVALKLATPAKTTAKSTAITKAASPSYSSLTARPTQSSEETARRRANTDIGWLD